MKYQVLLGIWVVIILIAAFKQPFGLTWPMAATFGIMDCMLTIAAIIEKNCGKK